jgi:hypothetical protein
MEEPAASVLAVVAVPPEEPAAPAEASVARAVTVPVAGRAAVAVVLA